MMVEVRCCCRPQRLLGWLPYSGPMQAGRVMRFGLSAPAFVSLRELPDHVERTEASYIELPLAVVVQAWPQEGDRRTWLAFKSEETPLAVLRRVPGFVPNERGEDNHTDGQDQARKDPDPRRPQAGEAREEGCPAEASAAG